MSTGTGKLPVVLRWLNTKNGLGYSVSVGIGDVRAGPVSPQTGGYSVSVGIGKWEAMLDARALVESLAELKGEKEHDMQSDEKPKDLGEVPLEGEELMTKCGNCGVPNRIAAHLGAK